MGGSASFKWTRTTPFDNAASFNDRADQVLTRVTSYFALRAEQQAKTRAPWTDRSTNARSGLGSQPMTENGVYRVVLFHTVTYGKWLEIRWGGKWGIIEKTVTELTPEYTKMMTEAIQRVMAGG